MQRHATFVLVAALFLGPPAHARVVVEASAPQATSVTIYRDPDRAADAQMDREGPGGFAMITETRTVTLPPGESTIRFTGVSEGMIAVSAIVTGLPGGTIEKNRNGALLSPGALVDGTLGNRVRITRTNPATGQEASESAIVRTRADGGLVLQTAAGFEAVRCAGLPERLTFDRVPAGLSPQPVFSIDTQDGSGGTYAVQLTYLSWGFDWEAHYVATLDQPGRDAAMRMRLMSWLTVLNDNGQSFPDAELLVVAGTLNVVSDFEALVDPPEAQPLQLTCYPFGSTAAGSPVSYPASAPPPPAPPPMLAPQAAIVVTAQRRSMDMAESGSPLTAVSAEEENLGDLKLYRVPGQVTVAAKGLKQVAFMDLDRVEGQLLYQGYCTPSRAQDEPGPLAMLMVTKNDGSHGLGKAMPAGGITFYEPGSAGLHLVAEDALRDHAQGQDVELDLGESAQARMLCERMGDPDLVWDWAPMHATFSNANPVPVTVRLQLGYPSSVAIKGLRGATVKNGQRIVELTVPANGTRVVRWQARVTN